MLAGLLPGPNQSASVALRHPRRLAQRQVRRRIGRHTGPIQLIQRAENLCPIAGQPVRQPLDVAQLAHELVTTQLSEPDGSQTAQRQHIGDIPIADSSSSARPVLQHENNRTKGV